MTATAQDVIQDGIHSMVPREKMPSHVRKYRDVYGIVPGAPIYHREFGFYCREAWKGQGLSPDADFAKEFHYDPPAKHQLGGIGWCEAPFVPAFDVKIIEERGDHEVEQDFAGRHVLYFKGRRSGFMPEYIDHPVKDMKTWEENIRWRLSPDTPERWEGLEDRIQSAKTAAGQGMFMTQGLVGGYMYLRSLIGPAELLYMFYDNPELIHACMQTWLEIADAVCAKHQAHICYDEVFFAEDICYNHGPLISPRMMKKFLTPYYRQLMDNIKSRQIDTDRKLHVQVDTDGFANPVIDTYREAIGMTAMSPFEVASNCDVVRTGKEYPELVISGGIDKRELAKGRKAIDAMLDRIIPTMRERGGYIPTCDHGVPEEVSLADYRYYRERMVELGG